MTATLEYWDGKEWVQSGSCILVESPFRLRIRSDDGEIVYLCEPRTVSSIIKESMITRASDTLKVDFSEYSKVLGSSEEGQEK